MLDKVASSKTLREMRREVAALRPIDYGLFARSMLSKRDAELLRHAARVTESGEMAAEILRNLYTQGGVGNLTSVITVWLEREEDFSDVLVSGGLVLWKQACDLSDGTALRALFEFSCHDSIRINRDRVLEDIGKSRGLAIMEMSREEQIAGLINEGGELPRNRLLWLLRTYAEMPIVQRYLDRFIRAGNVSALTSSFFLDAVVPWEQFDKLMIESPDRRRLVVALAIENCMRGASVQGLLRSAFGTGLTKEESAEIAEEVVEGTCWTSRNNRPVHAAE
jgi:hypothetical protein